jgi:hypothetical protein
LLLPQSLVAQTNQEAVMSARTFPNRRPVLRGTGPAISLVMILAASPAMAAPMAGGSAYDLSVNVSILTAIPSLVVPSQAQVNFSPQAAAFSDSQTAGPLSFSNVPVSPQITLQTGLTSADTAWFPPSTPGGFLIVGSEASVTNVNLSAASPPTTHYLDLTASLVRSTAVVSGYCPPVAIAKATHITETMSNIAADAVFGNDFDLGNLRGGTGAGGGVNSNGDDSSNAGVSVSVNGNAFAGVTNNPPPNSQTCLPGNVACLTLNEQTVTGDGVSTLSVSRNGLHLTANIPGVVAADVILAHSSASVACN